LVVVLAAHARLLAQKAAAVVVPSLLFRLLGLQRGRQFTFLSALLALAAQPERRPALLEAILG